MGKGSGVVRGISVESPSAGEGEGEGEGDGRGNVGGEGERGTGASVGTMLRGSGSTEPVCFL